jgi:hypothetical protein
MISIGRIGQLIFHVRGHKVMLSNDLAHLYGVEPRALVQAVQRNLRRFPGDFMFQVSRTEYADLKSQNVISSWGGLRRAMPYAFTEQGVAMLSAVLNSERAIAVSIAIMRTFVKLRSVLASHKELARQLETIERRLAAHHSRLDDHGDQISAVFEAIRRLMEAPEPSRKRIGFVTERPS